MRRRWVDVSGQTDVRAAAEGADTHRADATDHVGQHGRQVLVGQREHLRAAMRPQATGLLGHQGGVEVVRHRELLGRTQPARGRDTIADRQLVQTTPARHGAEGVVRRGGDLPARQSRSRNAGLRPLGKAWVMVAGTIVQSSARLQTGTFALAGGQQLSQGDLDVGVGARSADSAIRQPDSLRSASIGRLSARSSSWRESCDRAITGVSTHVPAP